MSRERNCVENFQKNVEFADRVRKIADEKGITPGQLALAWLLAQGEDIVRIPGTKRRERLEENAGAADVELTEDDLRCIEEALPRGSASGEQMICARSTADRKQQTLSGPSVDMRVVGDSVLLQPLLEARFAGRVALVFLSEQL